MKNIFTFFMAVMIVGAAFAQNIQKQQSNFVLPQVQKTAPLKLPAKHVNDSKTTQSFWFDYSDALQRYGYPMEGDSYPLCGDTTVYYSWSDSDPSASIFIGIGSYFDWTHSSWNNFYLSSSETVPAIWTSQDYTIDTVEISFVHILGTDVSNPNMVDTLVINYVINLDEERASNWYGIDTTTGDTIWYGCEISLPVNFTTFSLAEENSELTLDENVRVIEQKVPILADTVWDYTTIKVATPEELQHLNCMRLAVYYTYKPGPQAEGNTIMKTTANLFQYGYCEDPRDEYINGGDAPRNDMNTDFTVATPSIVQYPSNYFVSRFYGQTFLPGLLWTPTHSFISLHVVCDDCGVVNVPEMENNNVTIYPNPATSVITVNNNNNEKTLVEMYNLVGQKVYSEQFVNTTNINVSNMKAGVYMLKVNNHTTKVVVR